MDELSTAGGGAEKDDESEKPAAPSEAAQTADAAPAQQPGEPPAANG